MIAKGLATGIAQLHLYSGARGWVEVGAERQKDICRGKVFRAVPDELACEAVSVRLIYGRV